ncbi:MAG: hypothetical protein S4CHLAM102_09020 [Chlamydiia bacterium]|nr:hypothetical protein [Chlamydiia bacterium]
MEDRNQVNAQIRAIRAQISRIRAQIAGLEAAIRVNSSVDVRGREGYDFEYAHRMRELGDRVPGVTLEKPWVLNQIVRAGDDAAGLAISGGLDYDHDIDEYQNRTWGAHPVTVQGPSSYRRVNPTKCTEYYIGRNRYFICPPRDDLILHRGQGINGELHVSGKAGDWRQLDDQVRVISGLSPRQKAEIAAAEDLANENSSRYVPGRVISGLSGDLDGSFNIPEFVGNGYDRRGRELIYRVPDDSAGWAGLGNFPEGSVLR